MPEDERPPIGGPTGRPADLRAVRTQDEPHPSRLAPDDPRRGPVLAAHRAAMDAGEAGYPDPTTGLYVLTASYLLERGTCCRAGCRHCPYVD
jgi:hypothetical protein